MYGRARGFTLIELIAVIVILGVIAASAVPRFVDLSEAARQSSVDAIAGSLGSASALNYANRLLQEAGLPTDAFRLVLDCGDAERLLDGGIPAGYQIANPDTSVDQLENVSCEVINQNFTTIRASFTLHGT